MTSRPSDEPFISVYPLYHNSQTNIMFPDMQESLIIKQMQTENSGEAELETQGPGGIFFQQSLLLLSLSLLFFPPCFLPDMILSHPHHLGHPNPWKRNEKKKKTLTGHSGRNPSWSFYVPRRVSGLLLPAWLLLWGCLKAESLRGTPQWNNAAPRWLRTFNRLLPSHDHMVVHMSKERAELESRSRNSIQKFNSSSTLDRFSRAHFSEQPHTINHPLQCVSKNNQCVRTRHSLLWCFVCPVWPPTTLHDKGALIKQLCKHNNDGFGMHPTGLVAISTNS